MDLRGHGTSSVRTGRGVDFGYETMVARDWPASIWVARECCSAGPIVLLGHSLGGQLSPRSTLSRTRIRP